MKMLPLRLCTHPYLETKKNHFSSFKCSIIITFSSHWFPIIPQNWALRVRVIDKSEWKPFKSSFEIERVRASYAMSFWWISNNAIAPAYYDDNAILHSIIIVQLCGNFWSPDFHRVIMDRCACKYVGSQKIQFFPCCC